MITKQFTLYLENKPGSLASVTSELAKNKVNIEGISVATSADVGIVQLVTDSPVKTRRVLHDKHIAFTTQDVAVLALRNEPGALAEVAARLAKKGVNINYVYATACDCNQGCRVLAVISAPDLKAVEDAWPNKDKKSRG